MPEINLRLPPVLRSVPVSRHTARGFLEECGVDQTTTEDALIVVTELMSNGVYHDGGDDIALRLWSDCRDVTVVVVTADRVAGRAGTDRELERYDETGNGLRIVGSLSDQVTTLVEDGRRTTRCVLRAPAGT